MTGTARRLLLSLASIAALVVLGTVPGLGIRHLFTPAQAAAPLGFGPSTIVDDQREGGEPDIRVCGTGGGWSYGNCGQNNPYLSAPYGFSTTSSWVWRSEDGGKTFRPVPSNNTTGKPDACPGGGDTDLAVQPGATQANDYLNFIDLQGLTNFSTGVSADGGTSFTCDPASSLATVVDRQWFGMYGNPAGASQVATNGSAVYVDYDLIAGPSCATASGAAGNTFVVQKSTDGGLTYGPTVTADCNDGISGPIQVNQTNGHVFAIHTSYANPASTNTADAVTVDRSTDGGSTWTRHVVYACKQTATTDCTTGQDFAVLTIDKSNNLYAVWSQAPTDAGGTITGPSHIFYSYSTNEGDTWSAPKQVDKGSTNVDLFPWVVAGNAGSLDVVWYGTTKAASVPSYDPGSQQSNWFVYMAQVFKANSAFPSISAPVPVSQHANHWGGICTMGLGCTTGGDRSLADFFEVALNKQGAAVITWTDTSNNSNTSASGNESGLIMEAQQIAGLTLFGTTMNGASPICTSVTATSCQADQSGDARSEVNGVIGADVPKLDITGSSVNIDPSNHSRLDVRMKVADLSSLPSATDTAINPGDGTIDYLTSWDYHIPGQTDAQFDATGNIFYAYLEVNRATGGIVAYDGTTCGVATTKAKYFVYPGQNAISYKLTPSTGTIDLYVPLADVGHPPAGALLYSVAAHTVGQAAAAGPFACTTRDPNGNAPDPSGQIFNVYDKSPAYTAKLTVP